MRRTIPFGGRTLDVDFPERTIEIAPPAPLPALADPDAAIRRALAEPLGHAALADLVRPGMRVTVAFDDGCIPAFPVEEPDFRARALPVVLETLEARGVRPRDVRLLCANALHRRWTRGEMAAFLGPAIPLVWPPQRLFCHDAEDPQGLVHLGETERGMEVVVNRLVVESDLLVYLNVTPAPMNGGWKSVVVGLSDFRSIRHHHRPWPFATGHSIMDPRRSAFQKLLGEMGAVVEEALDARGRPPIFTVEAAYTNEMPARLAAVHAGAIPAVHPRTLEVVERQLVVPLERPVDVAAIGLPDRDPYSTGSVQNPILAVYFGLTYAYGLHQGRPPVREGGALILASPLAPRFDDLRHPSYREFYERVIPATRDALEAWDLFVEDFWRRPEFLHAYRHGFGFHGTHPFFMWNATLAARRHFGRLIFAGCEVPEVARRLGFEAFPTVEAAIASCEADLGSDCSVLRWTLPPPVLYRTE